MTVPLSDKLRPRSLKGENAAALLTVFAANAAVFVTLVTSRVFALPILDQALQKAQYATPGALALVACGVLNELISPDMKARLVWWRWRNPMPGTRAFTELGPKDSRIDMARLGEKHGPLPSDPAKQNSFWYSNLYNKVKNEALILSIHKSFLFNRDYASFSCVVLFTLVPIAIYYVGWTRECAAYAGAAILQYLITRQAASNRGDRLVTTVMASSY